MHLGEAEDVASDHEATKFGHSTSCLKVAVCLNSKCKQLILEPFI